jgi:hypothetical protein
VPSRSRDAKTESRGVRLVMRQPHAKAEVQSVRLQAPSACCPWVKHLFVYADTSAWGAVLLEMVARTGITGVLTSVALIFAAVLSPAAWGTFPGQNGRIAFDADGTIATMEPDGSDVRFLGPGNQPAWSPHGRRIVFNRCVDGQGFDLYTTRLA